MVFYAAKIPGSITFDREFTDELTDKTSPEYQAVAQESEHEVKVPVLLLIGNTHFCTLLRQRLEVTNLMWFSQESFLS